MNRKMEQLYDVFRTKGYNPVQGTIYQQQEKWLSWYRGVVNDFHFFTVKGTNGRRFDRKKKSLNMAKKVGEDWAGLLFNEKTRIVVDNEKAQARLDKVLKNNNFTYDMSDFIEKVAAAYGTGCLIEYTSNGEIEIDYVLGKVIPIDYTNGRIDAITTIQEFTENKTHYTHVTYHTFKEGVYRIEHELYSAPQKSYLGSRQYDLSVLFNKSELEELHHAEEDAYGNIKHRYYLDYETSRPFFQVFKLALSNNFDVNSPMGITATANSLSVLENIDEAYYNMYLEGITSRRRIMINSEATKIQKVKEENGNMSYISYFDVDDPLLQSVPMSDDIPFKEYAPEHRAQSHIDTLKFEMAILSNKVGLGDYYSYDKNRVVTATEIISRNSETWKNREKHIKRLEEVLENMAYAILKLEQSINPAFGVNVDELEIKAQFDDSIIKDDEQELKDMKADAESGAIPMWRYVAKKYKISPEEAKEWVAEAKGENDISAMFGIESRDIDDES